MTNKTTIATCQNFRSHGMEIAARRLVRFSRGVKKLTFYEKRFVCPYSSMQSYLQCYEIRVHRKYVSLAYF